jgi:hypothetical protein
VRQAETGGAVESRRVIGILGTALFRKVGGAQRMVGYLDTQESVAALLMHGTLHAAFLDVAYAGDQGETTLLIHHQTSSVEVGLADSAVKAKFILRVTASVEESQVATEQPETEERFLKGLVYTAEGQMEALLERVFLKLKDLGADVIGLGRKVQTKFGTYEEWEAFDWPGRFKDATAVFDIKMGIPTTGFTIQKPYPR